jgi:hypothetical protein
VYASPFCLTFSPLLHGSTLRLPPCLSVSRYDLDLLYATYDARRFLATSLASLTISLCDPTYASDVFVLTYAWSSCYIVRALLTSYGTVVHLYKGSSDCSNVMRLLVAFCLSSLVCPLRTAPTSPPFVFAFARNASLLLPETSILPVRTHTRADGAHPSSGCPSEARFWFYLASSLCYASMLLGSRA